MSPMGCKRSLLTPLTQGHRTAMVRLLRASMHSHSTAWLGNGYAADDGNALTLHGSASRLRAAMHSHSTARLGNGYAADDGNALTLHGTARLLITAMHSHSTARLGC